MPARKIFYILTTILVVLGLFPLSSQKILALDLTEYIAQPDFVPHSLSTGEAVSFTDEGGSGPGSPVRQYKNANYEQFFVGGGGIYRREDTSWAPLPGFQDAYCSNGNKAIYTLDPGCRSFSDGQTVTNSGAKWAPSSASVGDSWSTEVHQVLTIDNDAIGTEGNLQYCSLRNLSGYEYPNACGQTATIEFKEQYSPGEFEFCTGITNEEDLIVLQTIAGPGTGDTFYFMKGWGLVGFEAPGFESGLMGDGADTSQCTGAEDEERTWQWEPVSCNQTQQDNPPYNQFDDASKTGYDVEFHSLRPYPGNPCPAGTEEVEKVIMCANMITASEGFGITFKEEYTGEGNWNCTLSQKPVNLKYETLSGPKEYNTTKKTWSCDSVPILSQTNLSIDLTDAELPVLGNTEDVANGVSGTSALSYANRMNNYVSWYLQGAVQRAEEDFVSPTNYIAPASSGGIRDMLDYSGPLQKLYPLGGNSSDGLTGMKAQRYGDGQENLNLGDSHNQIVVCTSAGPEACYISESQNRIRKDSVKQNILATEFSYIPLSTTEDEFGFIRIKQTGNQAGEDVGNEIDYLNIANPNRITSRVTSEAEGIPWLFENNINTGIKNYDVLFFPHTRESLQLADALQRTFAPSEAFEENWIDSDSGMPGISAIEYEDDNENFCKVKTAYTNPGDNLYGSLDELDYTNPLDSKSTNAIPSEWENMAKEVREFNTRLVYEGTVECEFEEGISAGGFASCMGKRTETVESIACLPQGGEFLCPTGSSNVRIAYGNSACGLNEVACITSRKQEVDSPNYINYNPEACLTRSIGNCSTTTMASAKVEVESPWLESIFNRLVNGGMSVYRRIFPRIAANNYMTLPPDQLIPVPGPDFGFENIPGYTTVKYGSTNLDYFDKKDGGGFVDNTGNSAFAADPSDRNSKGELYFPYLGSIHEYFLKGVQCAYLPAGVGCENIDQAVLDKIDRNKGYMCIDEEAEPAGAFPGLPGTPSSPPKLSEVWPENTWPRFKNTNDSFCSKSRIINYVTQSGVFPNSQIEEYFDLVVGTAKSRGVSPAFALAMWIEESGASDYQDLCTIGAVGDFGIAAGSTPRYNIEEQLGTFLGLVNGYNNRDCFDGYKPFERFMLSFSEGSCNYIRSNDYTFTRNPAFPGRVKRIYEFVKSCR